LFQEKKETYVNLHDKFVLTKKYCVRNGKKENRTVGGCPEQRLSWVGDGDLLVQAKRVLDGPQAAIVSPFVF
jgi:hypothetical protein